MARLRAVSAFEWVVAALIENFAEATDITWPWVAVIMALGIAFPEAAVGLLMPERVPKDVPLADQVTVFLVLFASFTIAYRSFAVNWHRYILLRETPDGWKRLRLDWPVFRYFGNIWLIGAGVAVIGGGLMKLVLFAKLPSLLDDMVNLGNGPVMTAAVILAHGLAVWAGMIYNLTAITLLYAILGRGCRGLTLCHHGKILAQRLRQQPHHCTPERTPRGRERQYDRTHRQHRDGGG